MTTVGAPEPVTSHALAVLRESEDYQNIYEAWLCANPGIHAIGLEIGSTRKALEVQASIASDFPNKKIEFDDVHRALYTPGRNVMVFWVAKLTVGPGRGEILGDHGPGWREPAHATIKPKPFGTILEPVPFAPGPAKDPTPGPDISPVDPYGTILKPYVLGASAPFYAQGTAAFCTTMTSIFNAKARGVTVVAAPAQNKPGAVTVELAEAVRKIDWPSAAAEEAAYDLLTGFNNALESLK
jgi:hypothetical protein